MKRRLEQFYESFGDKGVMFILYVLGVVINVLLSIFAELPAIYPDEINAAGAAAMYSGKDWTGLLNSMEGGSGYVQALFYTPLFRVISNPYALYKAMLIVNALLVSFIPLIVYHLAGKFGVLRVRRKLLIAVCCGMYIEYITNSKFIWNEAFTCLFVWLLALCLFTARDRNNTGSRVVYSVFIGFLCAAAFALNKHLAAIVFALILTVIFARIVLREKILNLPIFALSLFGSFTAEHFLRMTIYNAFWGIDSAGILGGFAPNREPAGNLFELFFSYIYAFMTSSMGMGALAAAIFVVILYTFITEGTKGRAKTLEDGTKVYEPVKHEYSPRLMIFAAFQFLSVGCTAAVSSFFTFGENARDAEIFARYTDAIAPFAIFLVLVYIFLYGLDIKKTIIGAAIYGYSCFCFAVAGYPMIQHSGSFMYSSLFGIFPMILGDGAANNTPGMRYVVMSSVVFTLYALIIVFVSCSRRRRTALVTGTIMCILLSTVIYAGTVYIPRVSRENSEELAACKQVAGMLYNNSQSPPIIAYKTEPKFAGTLQFLVPDTRVIMLGEGEKVSEPCLLVAQDDAGVPFDGGSYDVVGRQEGNTLYAYGESARDFIRYSAANGRPDAESTPTDSAVSTSSAAQSSFNTSIYSRN